MKISSVIEKNLSPPDGYIYGYADLHGLVSKKYPGYNYGISIGRRLNDDIVDKLVDGPTIEYFNHYKLVNAELAALTRRIKEDLSGIGVDSLEIPPTIFVGQPGYEKYMERLAYDISHKMVATRAGLGWIGKTDLFISKGIGPRLRLVSILIKQKPDFIPKPVEKSRCGKCNICVIKCPAGAANGKLWNVNVFRDEFFNAFKCREKCGELAKERLNVDEHICGLCVNVCPVGKHISGKKQSV